MIVFVVFVSPIVLSMPALGVGIPPPVAMAPAIFASFREVVTGAIGFGTAIAVVLDSLVKAVVGAINASLAVVSSARKLGAAPNVANAARAAATSARFAEVVYPSMWQVHLLSLLW